MTMIPAYSGTCIDVYSAVNCPVVIRLMLGADNCSVCDLTWPGSASSWRILGGLESKLSLLWRKEN